MAERSPQHPQHVDIRSSSFGKASNFLAHLQTAGLLQLGLRGGGGEEGGKAEEVQAVQRQHDLFRTHAEAVKVADPEAFRAALAAVATSKMLSHLSGGGTGMGAASGGVVAVLDLYRFPRPLKEVLEAHPIQHTEEGAAGGRLEVVGEYGECLTGQEVQRLVLAYVAARGLQDTVDRKYVMIPPTDGLHQPLARRVKRGSGNPATPAPTSVAAVLSTSPVLDAVADEEEEGDEEEWEEGVERQLGERPPGDGSYRMVAGVLVATSSSPAACPGIGKEPAAPKKKKPVHLPPAAPAPSSSQQQQKQQRQQKQQQREALEEPPAVLRLSKEQLLAHVKGLLTKYHAIVLPSGASYFSDQLAVQQGR
jgi:hypothetical protein